MKNTLSILAIILLSATTLKAQNYKDKEKRLCCCHRRLSKLLLWPQRPQLRLV